MIEYIHKIFFSSGFVDIVTIRRHFQNFLSVRKHCTCYSNPWIADSIPPCRYICQEVRRGCEPLLRLMGYTWPDEVECGRFPTQAPCLNGTGILFPSATTSTTSITSTTQTPRTIPTTTSTRTTTDLSEHHHSRTRVLGRNFWPFLIDCRHITVLSIHGIDITLFTLPFSKWRVNYKYHGCVSRCISCNLRYSQFVNTK